MRRSISRTASPPSHHRSSPFSGSREESPSRSASRWTLPLLPNIHNYAVKFTPSQQFQPGGPDRRRPGSNAEQLENTDRSQTSDLQRCHQHSHAGSERAAWFKGVVHHQQPVEPAREAEQTQEGHRPHRSARQSARAGGSAAASSRSPSAREIPTRGDARSVGRKLIRDRSSRRSSAAEPAWPRRARRGDRPLRSAVDLGCGMPAIARVNLGEQSMYRPTEPPRSAGVGSAILQRDSPRETNS